MVDALGQSYGTAPCNGFQRSGGTGRSPHIDLNTPIVDTVSFSGNRSQDGSQPEAPQGRRAELMSSAGRKALWGLGLYLPAMALSAYATPALIAGTAGTAATVAGLASGVLGIAGAVMLGWGAINLIRGLVTKSDEPASAA